MKKTEKKSKARKFPEVGYVYWDADGDYWIFTTDPDVCIDENADAVFRYKRDAEVIITRETSVVEKH